MKKIEVLFFATMRSATGIRQISIDVADETRVSDLKNIMAITFPEAKLVLKAILVSINKEFAFDDDLIPDGAEVAMFPHVSGG